MKFNLITISQILRPDGVSTFPLNGTIAGRKTSTSKTEKWDPVKVEGLIIFFKAHYPHVSENGC
jgi:hypothetical protein